VNNGVLAGLVTFVDTLQQDGFAGSAGQAGLAATSDEVSMPMPLSATAASLQVRVASGASGVTVRLLKNDLVTALTCTTSPAGTCSAMATPAVAFAPGDRVSVEVQHTGGLLRGVRWSIALEA
jgi:hypothetical protein